MLSACWGALPCDGDVSPNDCQPTPAAHLPCMICADDLSARSLSRSVLPDDGRNGGGWHFFVCKPSPHVVFMTKQHPSIAPAHHGFFVVLAEEVHPCYVRVAGMLTPDQPNARRVRASRRRNSQPKVHNTSAIVLNKSSTLPLKNRFN